MSKVGCAEEKRKSVRQRVTQTSFMQSHSTSSRGTSRQPHPDRISPHARPQAFVSPSFSQSVTPSTFPTPFPTPQYDYHSRSTPIAPAANLSPNWRRPRATSSYSLESANLAFPEPQIHRGTSIRGISRPPSPPPRSDSETTSRVATAVPHRNSVTGPKIQRTEVALRIDLKRHHLYVFSSST